VSRSARGALKAGFMVSCFLLVACSTVTPTPPKSGASNPDTKGTDNFSQWQAMKLPGKKITEYLSSSSGGRDALAARSDGSASMFRRVVNIAPDQLGRLVFSWKVQDLIPQADLGVRESEDAPVRVVLAFEGDRSKFSMRDSMLSELARTLTGEPMPYATLMYVWCNTRPPESIIQSQRTDRIRKIVVESGAQNLMQWRDYERDIRADYLRVFGEAPGALVGVAIMTDSDNTKTSARAWYGPVKLTP
jgi:hypothetical protein